MPPVLWRGWIPFCRYTERKKVRNKQVVLLIAGISGIATGIIVSLNIPFIRQGLFIPPVLWKLSFRCVLPFLFLLCFCGAIVGWISVSYYSRITCLNESSEISEETYNERKRNDAELKTEKLNGIMIMNAGFLIYILICFLCSLLPELFMGDYAQYF